MSEWVLLLVGLVAPAVTAWITLRRLGRLAGALGLSSLAGRPAEVSAVMAEFVSRVRESAGPDGRIHVHDVEVISSRLLRGGRR